jgi:hypothetical protein
MSVAFRVLPRRVHCHSSVDFLQDSQPSYNDVTGRGAVGMSGAAETPRIRTSSLVESEHVSTAAAPNQTMQCLPNPAASISPKSIPINGFSQSHRAYSPMLDIFSFSLRHNPHTANACHFRFIRTSPCSRILELSHCLGDVKRGRWGTAICFSGSGTCG